MNKEMCESETEWEREEETGKRKRRQEKEKGVNHNNRLLATLFLGIGSEWSVLFLVF